MIKFFAGLFSGVVLTFVCIFLFFIYMIFFTKRNPEPPRGLAKNITIEEVSAVPGHDNEVVPTSCDETISEVVTETFPDGQKTLFCKEYVLDKKNSIIDTHSFLRRPSLIQKYSLENGEVMYVPLFSSIDKSSAENAPERNYEVASIKKDGTIYFNYGGWGYLEADVTGRLLYKMKAELK